MISYSYNHIVLHCRKIDVRYHVIGNRSQVVARNHIVPFYAAVLLCRVSQRSSPISDRGDHLSRARHQGTSTLPGVMASNSIPSHHPLVGLGTLNSAVLDIILCSRRIYYRLLLST